MIHLAVAIGISLSTQDLAFILIITFAPTLVMALLWFYYEEYWVYEGGIEVRTRFHGSRFYPWDEFVGYRVTYNKFTKKEEYRTYWLVLDSRTRMDVANWFENTDAVWRTITENVPLLKRKPSRTTRYAR